MSSRILLDDAGPGTREPAPPPAPEPTDREKTAAEPQERREDVSATPVAPEGESASPAPADGDAEPSEPEPGEDERDKQRRRIDQLTLHRRAAERERDQYRAELLRIQQQQQPPPQPGQPDRAQYERDVQQGIANRAFDQACNSLYARGREEYGTEMDDAVSALVAVGYGDVQQNPAAYLALNELAESPNGHRLYRELAGDLDNAVRILRLPPNMIIREIARMEARLASGASMSGGNGAPPAEPAARAPVSRAPDPVRHIGGRSAQPPHRLDDPNMDMASWIRERDRQERRSRIAR